MQAASWWTSSRATCADALARWRVGAHWRHLIHSPNAPAQGCSRVVKLSPCLYIRRYEAPFTSRIAPVRLAGASNAQ